MGNIFELAYMQLDKEGNLGKKDVMNLFWNRAIKIRRYLDNAERNKKVAINRYK